jgi:peptidoglycan hydrolase-like protein with peptidoglycan-binding domain
MRGSEPDLPDETARATREPARRDGAKRDRAPRGEIQALLESPELRRIFEDKPARRSRLRPARAEDGRRENGRRVAPEPPGGPGERASQPAVRRGSRKRRILVGLAPLYLAGLILFFETVREPSMFLEVFGTPSVAEEPAARAGAAIIGAAMPGLDVRQAPATETAEMQVSRDAAAFVGRDQTAPERTGAGVAVADTASATELDKAAADRAKREAAGQAAEAESGPDGTPAQAMGEAHPVLAGNDPPVPNLAHPDRRAGLTMVAEPIDPAVAEAAEEALRLSRGERREVQRRLRFADSDPQMIDGVFGPATRLAIAVWQEQTGLAATGFMDEAAMALLVEQTADEYRAWRTAEQARARESEEQSAVVASSARPMPARSHPEGCRRTASGEIAFGRDVGCNFRAFGENFRRDLRDLKGSVRQLFD